MTATAKDRVWVPRARAKVRGSMINLVNLLLRETTHRITIVQIDAEQEKDPELHVVTRLDWRDPDRAKPILSQLPKILSLLETLRGSRGVPSEIYLDSTEGIAVYLPTGLRISDIPEEPKEAVTFLMAVVETSVTHHLATMNEVEGWFWRVARQKGFSPEIVEKMGLKEKHYDSPNLLNKFHGLLRRYFSIRFRIHTAESCIRLEEG